jgi:hypothetical protein
VGTTAAVPTGTLVKILVGGKPAQFEGFGDVLAHGCLNLMHGFLSLEKGLGHRVTQENVAFRFELSDFFTGQGQPRRLLLLKLIPLLDYGLILALNGFVGHEGVDLPPDILEFGLVEDGLAKLSGLLDDNGIFGSADHSYEYLIIALFSELRRSARAGHKLHSITTHSPNPRKQVSPGKYFQPLVLEKSVP